MIRFGHEFWEKKVDLNTMKKKYGFACWSSTISLFFGVVILLFSTYEIRLLGLGIILISMSIMFQIYEVMWKQQILKVVK